MAKRKSKNGLTFKYHLGLLSLFYGLVVWIRNNLYDSQIISSRSWEIPIISVGNITAGGTGKTPHIEYLLTLLLPRYKVAVISRGYKRRTKGFRLVNSDSSVYEVGDEPLQIARKYPHALVVVDENRTRAIDTLLERYPETQVILLDDAFQHRKVQPGLSILLTDFDRIIYRDKLLPVGMLREPSSNIDRADIVVVTKSPLQIKPLDVRLMIKYLNIRPYQTIFFSHFQYESLLPLFPLQCPLPPEQNSGTKRKSVLLFTGIASNKSIQDYLSLHYDQVKTMTYADHHYFTTKDIDDMQKTFSSMPQGTIIVVTEKDAMRLITHAALSDLLKQHIYYQPIIPKIYQEEKLFQQKIMSYVQTHQRNRSIYKEKN